MKKILFLTVFLMFSLNVFAQNVPFTFTISNIKSLEGNIIVAICVDEEEFTTDYKCKYEFSIPPEKGSITKTIEIPNGSYAIKVYHDKNNNNRLDMAMFGKPTEYYGFSNNKYGAFGSRPPFQEALINIDGKTNATIKLRK